ncbi:MAG: hypothetical protein V2I62_11480 [Bacteroidales bacterium]|jgi:hypothetical protein|nr:hypothetical protein [Bacteroidales bacterium]
MTEILKTHIAFCIDESGSISGIVRPLVEAYNRNVASIRDSVLAEGQEATMTALTFGHRTLKHRLLYVGHQVQTIEELKDSDIKPSGMTPLFDSVYRAIEKLQELDDGKDGTTFVINVVTDGYENSSEYPGVIAAIAAMNEKIATDRWTFTFLVPDGNAGYFSNKYSIPRGNIQEWDTKTEKGTSQAFIQNSSAFSNYFLSKSRGIKSTKTFYSDLTDTTVRTVRSELSEITNQVEFIRPANDCQIRAAIIDAGKPYIKGSAFYQLIKTEKKVQPYKMVALRVKSSGKVFCGTKARELLGIAGIQHTVRLVPGDHAKFDVFIQSTSVNRKIPAGTEVMYWPKVGTQKK